MGRAAGGGEEWEPDGMEDERNGMGEVWR